jgi:hypothetical protein
MVLLACLARTCQLAAGKPGPVLQRRLHIVRVTRRHCTSRQKVVILLHSKQHGDALVLHCKLTATADGGCCIEQQVSPASPFLLPVHQRP